MQWEILIASFVAACTQLQVERGDLYSYKYREYQEKCIQRVVKCAVTKNIESNGTKDILMECSRQVYLRRD